jgi:hypothetical protein
MLCWAAGERRRVIVGVGILRWPEFRGREGRSEVVRGRLDEGSSFIIGALNLVVEVRRVFEGRPCAGQ